MKNLFIAALVASMAACVAQAGYVINWSLDPGEYTDFEYATLSVSVNGGEYQQLYYADYSTSAGESGPALTVYENRKTSIVSDDIAPTYAYSADAFVSDYIYQVQLIGGAHSGWVSTLNGSALTAGSVIENAVPGATTSVPSYPTTFTGFNAPEPTSGLLLLLGAAILALKRKVA